MCCQLGSRKSKLIKIAARCILKTWFNIYYLLTVSWIRTILESLFPENLRSAVWVVWAWFFNRGSVAGKESSSLSSYTLRSGPRALRTIERKMENAWTATTSRPINLHNPEFNRTNSLNWLNLPVGSYGKASSQLLLRKISAVNAASRIRRKKMTAAYYISSKVHKAV